MYGTRINPKIKNTNSIPGHRTRVTLMIIFSLMYELLERNPQNMKDLIPMWFSQNI